MKSAALALSLLVPAVSGAPRAQVRAPAAVQLPEAMRKLAISPEVVRRRAEYHRLPIARRSPAIFVHLDWSKIKVLGQEADLRPQIQAFGLGIRDQGYRGTCSVFALTFCQEFTDAKATGKGDLDFSEEYLNVLGDIAAGAVHDGGFYKDLNLGYQAYGRVLESKLPYHDPLLATTKAAGQALLPVGMTAKKYPADFIKDWDPNIGASAAQLAEVRSYLDKGTPVAVGLLWPAQGKMKKATIGGVEMMVKIPKSDTVDGHSVVLVGYKKAVSTPGGGYFIFRNSWGPGWGDQGYGYMSFEYPASFANDLLAYHQ